MGKSVTLSLGTDNIGKLLFNYATPAIIAMASSSLYHLIDSAFVGHGVGGAAIAGMAITMPIMNIGSAFGAMVGVGAGARISLRLGEGNKRAAEKTLCNAVILNVIIGFTIMALMLTFLDEILLLFSGGRASVETLQYAKEFMQIILIGNVTMHLYLGMNDMIRASGNPRKSMAIMLTSVAVNLMLNPLFIFKFGWGIKGSAAATVISQFVAFLIALSHFCSKSSFLRFKREAFHFDWKIVGNILSIGLAPFLMNICASMVAAFVNTAMLRYGGTGLHDIVTREEGAADLYVGAYGIVNRVALLFIMIIQGLNQGMQPIVGYNYGAKNFARVRKAVFMTIGCGMAIGTLGFILGQSIPEIIARAFVDSSKGGNEQLMVDAAAQGMRIILMMFPLVGFQVVVGGFFQYIGKAPLAIFVSLTRQLLFLLPLLWTLPRTLGAYGVWVSMPIADSASIMLAFILFVWQIRKINKRQ
ncbi:MAG: MATE family efflux transporter [Rikenellaceae bacterium]|nr:MATE family efflux transporter [Rikenellaceae bacterium]